MRRASLPGVDLPNPPTLLVAPSLRDSGFPPSTPSGGLHLLSARQITATPELEGHCDSEGLCRQPSRARWFQTLPPRDVSVSVHQTWCAPTLTGSIETCEPGPLLAVGATIGVVPVFPPSAAGYASPRRLKVVRFSGPL